MSKTILGSVLIPYSVAFCLLPLTAFACVVTGGTGFIGSHTIVELLNAGFDVIIVDNLCNSSVKVVDRIREISLNGDATSTRLKFYQVDAVDSEKLDAVFQENPSIHSVIHLAGLKAVGESTQIPLEYYRINLMSSINVINSMRKHGVRRLLFSSTATVYGEPTIMPITEKFAIDPKSPYAKTKMMIEHFIFDEAKSRPDFWHFGILRYFNPVGAHPSGKIGEDPNGIPNNLMPFISKVAVGKLPLVSVYGNDYPTRDGTGIRDYIHVVDLAEGHLAALQKLDEKPCCFVYNLGTGRGSSVLEMVAAFSRACGKEIPYKIVSRRPGDVPVLEADPSLAQKELGWVAKRGIDEMCVDSWRWQQSNPDGYRSQ